MVLASKLSRCQPLSSSPLEKTSRELQHRNQMINVPMEPKQQLITCPMNINGWTQGERRSTDVPLKNGHPPTIPWTWKETNLHQIPGKDEPQRMFLKRNHIRPQAHAEWAIKRCYKRVDINKCPQENERTSSNHYPEEKTITNVSQWMGAREKTTWRKNIHRCSTGEWTSIKAP